MMIRILTAVSAAISASGAFAAYFGCYPVCALLCAISFLLCSVCAVLRTERRGELLNTAADVIHGFPQVIGIRFLRVSRRHGRLKINAAVECNTYIVRGNGESTKRQLEHALTRKIVGAAVEVRICGAKDDLTLRR